MSDVKRYDCYGKDALGYDYPALSREAIDGDWVLAEDHIAECDALKARLEEAERDAVRYRWLRDRAWPFEFNGDTPADADAAIDAAMRPPAKKHTPRCSYWDGLFAQVCNCGAADNERA